MQTQAITPSSALSQEATRDTLRQFSVLYWLWKERRFQRVNRDALQGLLDIAGRGTNMVRLPVFSGSLPALLRSGHALLDLEEAREPLYHRHIESFAEPAKLRTALGIEGPTVLVDEEVSFLEHLLYEGWVVDVGAAATYGMWLRYFADSSPLAWERWRAEIERCDRVALDASGSPTYGGFLRQLHVLFARLVETYWAGRILLHAPNDIDLGVRPAREEVMEELDRLDERIGELRRPFRHPWLSLQTAYGILAMVLSQRGKDALRREAATMSLSRPLFPTRWGEVLAETVLAKNPFDPLLDRLREELPEGFRLGYECLNRFDPEKEAGPKATITRESAPEDRLVRALVYLTAVRPSGQRIGLGDLAELLGFTNEDRVEVIPLDDSRYIVEFRYQSASAGADLARRVLEHLNQAIELGQYLLRSPDAGLAGIRFVSRGWSQVIVLRFGVDEPPMLLVLPAEGSDFGPDELAATWQLMEGTQLLVGMSVAPEMLGFLEHGHETR